VKFVLQLVAAAASAAITALGTTARLNDLGGPEAKKKKDCLPL